MLSSITKKLYNEMGSGYEEAIILYDDEDESITLIYVGKFFENTNIPTDTTGMDKKGYIK